MNYSEKWKAERERKAYLALADGTVFHGVAFGAKKDALGEVVFNTGMCGYQEILTDPSYAGQFVTLTPAEVGNYGINSDDIESRKLFLSGLVIGDLTAPSNWRSEKSLTVININPITYFVNRLLIFCKISFRQSCRNAQKANDFYHKSSIKDCIFRHE